MSADAETVNIFGTLNDVDRHLIEHAVRHFISQLQLNDEELELINFVEGDMSQRTVIHTLLNAMGKIGIKVEPDDYVNI